MSASVLLALAPALGLCAPPAPPLSICGAPARIATQDGAFDGEYDRRYKAAKDDPSGLWELYEWCSEQDAAQRDPKAALARGARLLRRIVRLDPSHPRARQALGHIRVDGQWFANERALERHKRSEDEQSAIARGLVQYRRGWVHPDAVPMLRKGIEFDAVRGMWLDRRARRRFKAGWELQDEVWVRPDDVGNIDEGKWLVVDEWVDLKRANTLRSKIESRWILPGSTVRLHTTVDRDLALRATAEMEDAVLDLQRIFGVEPRWPVDVALWRTEAQYDSHAAGDPTGRRAPTHVAGLHVVYSGFFAESWFDRSEDDEPEFLGMGTSYWNQDVENGDLFGVHNARLALGLSYVDAIDPSRGAVQSVLEAEDGAPRPPGYAASYAMEKRLPEWLRIGAAIYTERYFPDRDVAPGRDLWWARKWSIDNLRSAGGLGDVNAVFAMPLDPLKPEECRALYLRAGLLIAYLVDGRSPAGMEAHGAWKAALASRDAQRIKAATQMLQGVLVKEQDRIAAFAGLEPPR